MSTLAAGASGAAEEDLCWCRTGRANPMRMEVDDLREGVRAAYSAAAVEPGTPHPFPVGRAFAESLGYPAQLLDEMPPASVESFAGVSNVSCFAELPDHGTVLDVGCGAGLDSLLVAHRMGPCGRVLGFDFSWPMLEKAHRAAVSTRAANLAFCQADVERIPVGNGVIDVALVNGIFNLNPTRQAIFRELARCIRPGGRLYGAELILSEPRRDDFHADARNWFA